VPEPGKSVLLGRYHKALREPLLHFFVAGLLLFVAGQVIRSRADTHHIVVTPQHEAQLANRYALQFGVRPDARMMAELVKSDLHDEILFREGLALGLDKDDEIVRRRIIQKMQFLLEDLQVPAEPGTAQLLEYYRMHSEQYRLPARATFTHIYFSDAGGAAGGRARAQRALEVLATPGTGTERAPGLGDPFPDLYDFSDYSSEQVEHLFGRTDFSANVFAVPLRQWAGPFRSAYGWHLVYVQSRAAAQEQPFATVRDKARADYLGDSQKQANESAFSALARQFTVARNRSAAEGIPRSASGDRSAAKGIPRSANGATWDATRENR
jgi:peptidyl-prolyl cis-trans isomerase C